VPIFDGHNDVLLRLYQRGGEDAPRTFLEGVTEGQDLRPQDGRWGGSKFGQLATMSANKLVTRSDTP